MKVIKFILFLAFFLIALAFGAQNQEIVTFNYLAAKVEIHLSWLLGLIFIMGFASALLLFGAFYIDAKLTIRRLNKKIKQQASVLSTQSTE